MRHVLTMRLPMDHLKPCKLALTGTVPSAKMPKPIALTRQKLTHLSSTCVVNLRVVIWMTMSTASILLGSVLSRPHEFLAVGTIRRRRIQRPYGRRLQGLLEWMEIRSRIKSEHAVIAHHARI